MKMYVKLEWPECQDFMEEYREELYFDPNKNVWFISRYIYNRKLGSKLMD